MPFFKITATDGAARRGSLQTLHGPVQTPCFVPVATWGPAGPLTPAELMDTGTGILIANTYHLHLRPGEDIVADRGGLAGFTGWERPFLTDSGGFQAFSMGALRTLGAGKVGATRPRGKQKPALIRIEEDGVASRSYVDGARI